MRQVLQDLIHVVSTGGSVAQCVLAETRGSTPQKPGATMLVLPDGSQSGTLGGGCVEADVKRHALRLIDQGDAELLTFHLDSDYGWDDGLICGGRMKLLVDPIRPNDDLSYFHLLYKFVTSGTSCSEAIVLDAETAQGGRSADRFLFDDSGQLVASRNRDAMPPEMTQNLRPVSRRPRPYVTAGIAYLTAQARCRLLIVGAGHIGRKVAELASEVDFDVSVLDDREEYCNPDRFPTASRLIVASIDDGLKNVDVDRNTMCIIVTRGHNHDEEALYHLAETSARYVGMIGSRRKIKLILEDLLREGISQDALARVHAPIGFDIGSQTVPEIAVSIVAELIAYRNVGSVPDALHRTSLLADIPDPSQTGE